MEVADNVMSASIEATITRADGTVETLGVIDEFSRPKSPWWSALLSRFTRQS